MCTQASDGQSRYKTWILQRAPPTIVRHILSCHSLGGVGHLCSHFSLTFDLPRVPRQCWMACGQAAFHFTRARSWRGRWRVVFTRRPPRRGSDGRTRNYGGKKWDLVVSRLVLGGRFCFRQHELMYEYESKSEPVSVIGCFFCCILAPEVAGALCGQEGQQRGSGGGRAGRRRGRALASVLLSKCENLHFYLLIYLTDRALKQPSINKRHIGDE